MDPVLLKSHAKLLFGLTLLVLHLVSLEACKDEPGSAKPGNCFNSSSISVQEEGSINVSVPLKDKHDEVQDLCIWNSSASSWKSVCHFPNDNGICKPLQNSFKVHITLVEKTLMLHNVSREATGIYKVLDMDDQCVAWINFTVEEGSRHANHGGSLTDFMFTAMLVLLPVAFCILQKHICL